MAFAKLQATGYVARCAMQEIVMEVESLQHTSAKLWVAETSCGKCEVGTSRTCLFVASCHATESAQRGDKFLPMTPELVTTAKSFLSRHVWAWTRSLAVTRWSIRLLLESSASPPASAGTAGRTTEILSVNLWIDAV